MKKIITSVGLIALGASSVHAVDSSVISLGSAKPWSVSASLRGFYDDNLNTSVGGTKTSTFGYTISPSATYAWSGGPTAIKAAYMYAFSYYDKRPLGQLQKYDQNHKFDISLDHAFNERYAFGVADDFVVGQEPDSLRYDPYNDQPLRTPGDNIRNTASLNLTGTLTPLFGLAGGYQNSLWDYHSSTYSTVPNTPPFTLVFPSIAGTLNRMEHSAHVEGRWQVLPQTTFSVGYQFGQANYTANQPIGVLSSGATLYSNNRDNRSHTGYVQLDHNFTPELSGSARVGLTDTVYYNDPVSHESDISPSANASLTYTYAVASSVEAGFSYARTATDLVGVSATGANGGFTRGSQTATIYGKVNHRIVSDLYGHLTGTYQNSSFIGGSLDGKTENYYMLEAELEYRFSPNFAATIAYDFDKDDSQAQRSFDRNRVTLGLTASY